MPLSVPVQRDRGDETAASAAQPGEHEPAAPVATTAPAMPNTMPATPPPRTRVNPTLPAVGQRTGDVPRRKLNNIDPAAATPRKPQARSSAPCRTPRNASSSGITVCSRMITIEATGSRRGGVAIVEEHRPRPGQRGTDRDHGQHQGDRRQGGVARRTSSAPGPGRARPSPIPRPHQRQRSDRGGGHHHDAGPRGGEMATTLVIASTTTTTPMST